MPEHLMEAHFNLKADADTVSKAHRDAIELSGRVIDKMTEAVLAGLGKVDTPHNRAGLVQQCGVIYVAVNAMMAALADEGIVRYEGISPEPAAEAENPDREPEADEPKGKRKHK